MRWFGVALFVLFSLGLTLFFQFDPARLRRRPELVRLGEWIRIAELASGVHVERRQLIEAGGLFQRAKLVEQERHRDPDTGAVLWVGEQRVLQRWYEP
jgi:hypothetical protein